MTKEVQFRRGSTSDHVDGSGFTGALAEVTVDTTNDTLRVHDGTTKGGHELVGVAATQRVTNKDIDATNLTVSGVSTFNQNVIINANLDITGNVSVAGTSFILNADQLRIEDKDIILAFTTTTTPNDNTANHAGVAVASNEGSFLVPLDVVGINTFPNTYKQMMWVKNGTMGAGTTDAWLFNNAVGVGSTLVPNGVYLAAGKVKITSHDIFEVRNIDALGIGTISRLNINSGITANEILVTGVSTFNNGPVFVGTATSTGTPSQDLQVTGGAYISSNLGIGTTNPSAILHIAAGSSTVNSAPIKVGSASTVMATPEAGAIEYDGTLFYATPNSSFGRAAIPTTLYTSGAGTLGITLNTNYALFPAANDTITLPVGTYLVRMRVRVAVTGSTASSALNLNIRGAGTAVGSFSWGGTGSILDAGAASSFIVAATALGTNIIVTAASAANPRQYIAIGQGILKVTTAGTIIPAYQYTTTLTSGTTALVADNYMIIQSLDSKSVQPAGPQGSGWG